MGCDGTSDSRKPVDYPDIRVGVRINPITHDMVWLTVRDLNMAA